MNAFGVAFEGIKVSSQIRLSMGRTTTKDQRWLAAWCATQLKRTTHLEPHYLPLSNDLSSVKGEGDDLVADGRKSIVHYKKIFSRF